MKLSFETFYVILWCFVRKIPILQAMELAHLSEPTAREWYQRFRVNIKADKSLILEQNVQMDESFFKKKALIMAKDTESKKIVLRVIDKSRDISREDITPFIFNHIRPGSKFSTDGNAIYKGIQHYWPLTHRYDVHSRFEFTLTSEIEGIAGNLRTFIRRMYHHTTCSKLPYVVAEFEARFNHPQMFQNPDRFLKNSLFLVPFA
jgi:hypothetical protein